MLRSHLSMPSNQKEVRPVKSINASYFS